MSSVWEQLKPINSFMGASSGFHSSVVIWSDYLFFFLLSLFIQSYLSQTVIIICNEQYFTLQIIPVISLTQFVACSAIQLCLDGTWPLDKGVLMYWIYLLDNLIKFMYLLHTIFLSTEHMRRAVFAFLSLFV